MDAELLAHAKAKLASLSDRETAVLYAIVVEVERAERKHPAWPADMIHQAMIVVEEAGELGQASLQMRCEQGTESAIWTEAVHTGATVVRLLKNL